VPPAGGAPETVWLFWARHDGIRWVVEGRSAILSGAAWVWSPVESVAASVAGDREPCAALDAAGRIWVIWARRAGGDPTLDRWSLWRRARNGAWGVEAELTPLPAGPVEYREPDVVRLATGNLRIFFRSTHAGGSHVANVTFNPATSLTTALAPVTAGVSGEHWPAARLVAPGVARLLFRSDRSVPLSRVATRPAPDVDNRVTSPPPAPRPGGPPPRRRSASMPDTGTAQRHVGATAVDLSDAARIGRHREWDDLLTYTPERPERPQTPEDTLDRAPDPLPADAIWYTRGTIGLFLSPFTPASPLSQELRQRLRPVLDRFLPITVRAVVRLTPRVFVEYVYTSLADIGECYGLRYPDIERYGGVTETSTTPLPWGLLRSATLTEPIPIDLTADPGDLATLRRRTFVPRPSQEGLMPSTEFAATELHGMYRDVITNAGGNVTFDSGWKKNIILDGFRRLLASFARGPSPTGPQSTALGIDSLLIGAGLAAWDTPPGPPPPDATRTTLYDANGFAVPHNPQPNADFQIDFLQGGTVAGTQTNALQIVVRLAPAVPPWPDANHPTRTLREFGLVGLLNGAPVLLNHVTHPAIVKDPTSTLERTIWLVF
jgi:hypothetical protein